VIKLIVQPPATEWKRLTRRPALPMDALEKPVQKIMAAVQNKGDKALYRFARKFDKVKISSLQTDTAVITAAAEQLPDALKNAIQMAAANIEKYHAKQQVPVRKVTTATGVQCWRESRAIESVGLYIPGGSAPLFSTVLMLAIPARLAGCNEIILCSPPGPTGEIHPAILYAAALCGITRVYKTGGAQAIAAMCYGTESIPQVKKIFGPGNQYVMMAKQLAQLEGVAIDMPAGPSEVLVIADAGTDPSFAAADLLSQAEHGPDSQVLLVCTDKKNTKAILSALKKQLKKLPRKKIAVKALEQSRAIVLSSVEEAIAFSNAYAPEHLLLQCANAGKYLKKITAAGSVFIGPWSPESAGDYASGTNHTLPTNGYAAMYSGVSLDSFRKQISFQELTEEGLQLLGPVIMEMAAAEGLDAHKAAVAIRLKNK